MEPNTKKSDRLHGNFLDLTDLVGGVCVCVAPGFSQMFGETTR